MAASTSFAPLRSPLFLLLAVVAFSSTCAAFSAFPALSALRHAAPHAQLGSRRPLVLAQRSNRGARSFLAMADGIVSPFDPSVDMGTNEDDDDEDEYDPEAKDEGPLALTLENVEKTLDKSRPYLMADGGNVRVTDIDGGVVRLKLEGACGTCPSSTMTMKMGLEKSLREAIPEIMDVVQDMGEGGPELTPEAVDLVLETVRPFLKVAGGTIELGDLRGVGSIQPVIILKMAGSSAALRSVKNEIMQRIQRNFMIPGLRIEWEKAEDVVRM